MFPRTYSIPTHTIIYLSNYLEIYISILKIRLLFRWIQNVHHKSLSIKTGVLLGKIDIPDNYL